MTRAQWHVQLRPSVLQFVLKILLFVCFILLCWAMMPVFWAVLLILVAGCAAYLCRQRCAIEKLAQLDQHLWSLQNQQGEIQQMRLIKVTGFAGLIILQFDQDTEAKKQVLYLSKDQVSATAWRILQQLKHLKSPSV